MHSPGPVHLRRGMLLAALTVALGGCALLVELGAPADFESYAVVEPGAVFDDLFDLSP